MTDAEKCKRKLRHTDYWSALLHARALGVEHMVIYPCPVCDGLHLGHTKLRYAAHCAREGELMVTGLLRRIQTHERVILEHTAIAQRLKRKLDEIINSYNLDA